MRAYYADFTDRVRQGDGGAELETGSILSRGDDRATPEARSGGETPIDIVGVIAVTAVVWIIMCIRSTDIRATFYSFPVPITIAILSGSSSHAGSQYIGVILLVGFTYGVALLDGFMCSTPAVAGALAGYIAASAALHSWLRLSDKISLVVAVVILGANQFWIVLHRALSVGGSQQTKAGWIEFAAVPLATSLTWLLGGLLGPYVVTYPYSGVPVALTTRTGRMHFAIIFAQRAWLLLGFLVIYHSCKEGTGKAGSLVIAWVSFLGATAVVQALTVRRLPAGSRDH